MDLKKQNFLSQISAHEVPDGFIKVTSPSVQTFTSEQKVILNRKGNELFNNGHVEEASRIFVTTGYSDGLTRVGDIYMKKNQPVKALKFYTLAKNKNKSEEIVEKLAATISLLVKEN